MAKCDKQGDLKLVEIFCDTALEFFTFGCNHHNTPVTQ